jgi:uncharacterized protein YndB with AHSA1/START domain
VKTIVLLLACLGLTSSVTPSTPSYRILRAVMTLDATAAEVWQLWTTEEGLVSFFAPAAQVEPRVDGRYDIFFNPEAREGERGADGMRILVYEPERRLSFTWNAPVSQPYVRAQRTVVTIALDPLPAGGTRMTFTHAGWGAGPEWDRAYDYFDTAWNAAVLPRLRHRLASGPLDLANPPVLEPIAPTLKMRLVQTAAQPAADAVRVLQAHLSHGIGESPFDSDVWHDPINAALVLESRDGTTLDDLDRIAGTRADLETRLALLQKHGFVDVDGTTVRTRFPILIGGDQREYMTAVSEAAGHIEQAMRAEWQALLDHLRDRGWQDWAYHVVWSQTMDSGFTWAPMMAEELVPPLSTLIVWVVYPQHPFKSGTNYFPDTEIRDRMLAVTWRPGAADTVPRVGRVWPDVWAAAVTGDATPESLERLRALGLVDQAGALRMPIIRQGDALYERLERLGAVHVRQMRRHLPMADLRRITRADDQVTFSMAYHDVSWELLRRMVDRGMFSVPAALQAGASGTEPMTGVSGLVDAHPAFIAELKKALGIR